MENKPLISVVTVSYNAVQTIETTILSVINQTYSNIEYIIIDGGSTDGTIDIIKKYEDKIAYWVSEPDKGIYDAMNKGIDKASGEWINFMNCGDSFYTNEVLGEVFNNCDFFADIIYGDSNCIYDIGQYMRRGSIVTEQNCMPFIHQASFVRKRLMKEHNFNIKYKICADRDFFYYAFKQNKKFKYVSIIISNYEAETGLSSISLIELMNEIGMIEGRNKSLKWKIKMWLLPTMVALKQHIKKILPLKITNALKKYSLSKDKNMIVY